ncbi:hypothetical protein [Ferrimonas senticii]|uniref:hypothetical protein n=1 Tax=Ferrimonas senticii TaxID=394566 RepID=UPI000482CC7B|nr:hypothetical protein [Ferrimonas senticii]
MNGLFENCNAFAEEVVNKICKSGKKNGSQAYFIDLVHRIIDCSCCELGNKELLKDNIECRLKALEVTNLGYKKHVIPVIQDAFIFVNK